MTPAKTERIQSLHIQKLTEEKLQAEGINQNHQAIWVNRILETKHPLSHLLEMNKLLL